MNHRFFIKAKTVAAFIFVVFVFAFPVKAQPLFTNVAPQYGLDDVGTCGGVFWYDYDDDGDMDFLRTARFNTTSYIYRNDNDHFTRLENIGLPTSRDAGKTIPIDFDHDGDMDMWLNEYASSCQLLVNENGVFEDRTTVLGLSGVDHTRDFTWIDINRDGWMDLLVQASYGWSLFRNDEGTHFTEITSSSQLPNNDGGTFAEADIDLDGDIDLFDTQIGGNGILYANNGNEVFVDITNSAGLSDCPASIGCAWADFNHDKYPDLITQNHGSHGIWLNNRDRTFIEMTVHGMETNFSQWPHGAHYFVADYDMDGDLDVYCIRAGGCGDNPANNQFFRQDSASGNEIWFTDIAPSMGMDVLDDGYGSIIDFDQDGDLDFCLVSQDNPIRLFRNNTVQNQNFLQIKVLGPNNEQDRWHTRVEVYRHGTEELVQASELNYSNVNRNGLNNYFVMDQNQSYDLRIYFSCGITMLPADYPQLSNVVPSQINHFMTVHMGVATSNTGNNNTNPIHEFRLTDAFPNPFNPSTTISFTIPKNSDVKLCIYNIAGQHIADIIDGNLTEGQHQAVWNAANCPSGIYFVNLRSDNYQAVQKIVLLK